MYFVLVESLPLNAASQDCGLNCGWQNFDRNVYINIEEIGEGKDIISVLQKNCIPLSLVNYLVLIGLMLGSDLI